MTKHFPAKTGEFREYSQNLKIARVTKKIPRIINTIASIWGENMHGYLSLDIICSSTLTVFLDLRFRKTVLFSEQVMSADRYPSSFSRKMEAIVYLTGHCRMKTHGKDSSCLVFRTVLTQLQLTSVSELTFCARVS